MKKLVLTIIIVLGLGLTTFADPNNGGLFQRGTAPEQRVGFFGKTNGTDTPCLPNHDLTDNQDAPLGTGIAVLAVLGGAYFVAKKRKEK